MSENISAISTAIAKSGVAVIRISGDSPLQIAEKMFAPVGKIAVCEFEPYRMYPGEIDCGGFQEFTFSESRNRKIVKSISHPQTL